MAATSDSQLPRDKELMIDAAILRHDGADGDHEQRRADAGAHAHDHADAGQPDHPAGRRHGGRPFVERQPAHAHVSHPLHVAGPNARRGAHTFPPRVRA